MECPLCMEPLEVDDLNFYPCTCGYQVRLSKKNLSVPKIILFPKLDQYHQKSFYNLKFYNYFHTFVAIITNFIGYLLIFLC